MKYFFPLLGTVIAACALTTMPSLAHANDSNSAGFNQTTKYINGGVGKDEQQAMRRDAMKYPLRMTFSERKDGEFLADIPVVISNASGKQIFVLPNAGPMLDVKLPNGQYSVTATFNGVRESRKVTLTGTDHKDLHFHWNGKAIV